MLGLRLGVCFYVWFLFVLFVVRCRLVVGGFVCVVGLLPWVGFLVTLTY